MAPIGEIWTRIVLVFDFLTGSPGTTSVMESKLDIQIPVQPPKPLATKYPIINPPDDLEPIPFRCEYPDMPEDDGWVACNTNTDRQCWLKNTKTGKQYNITTDYESDGPRGIIREYYIELSNYTRNLDGFGDVYVQLFNNSFPGPRLQACWGDQLQITINNTLLGSSMIKNPTHDDPGNGTTVHWHGIRQWKTAFSDGVNAVTQCPIPPSESFTYVFNVTQYGALGPLTVYGPMSYNFDHQVQPIIMSDWLHTSVYHKWDRSLLVPGQIFVDNILQNGIGHWPPLDPPTHGVPKGTKFNEVIFQKGVKYLLRLINGAADTTFVFSIDNHSFWVISTDFVAIKPYHASHIVVGIGQRYNIIVEANPDAFVNDVNFWIRTTPAPKCTSFDSSQPTPDEYTGIVRYTLNDGYPTTSRQNFTPDCADETYNNVDKIQPMVNWQIGKPTQTLPTFYLALHDKKNDPLSYPYYPCDNPSVNRFQLVQDHPMWLNFSYPQLLHGDDDYSTKPWLTVVDTADLEADNWIYMVIFSGSKSTKNPSKPRPIPGTPNVYVPSQHPIHLHGHDFAVLDQCVPPDQNTPCDLNDARLTTNNPPRRDVAFLPQGGYLILAFKADNPGAWIMHCHIAFHASMGLATQILENVDAWPQTFGFGWDEPFEDMCRQWDKWNPDDPSDPCMKHNPKEEPLQTDSGI